jgi:hypothetical protein
MDRDQILALSAEELRLAIAIEKGWLRHSLNPDVWLPNRQAYKFVPLPDWPGSIADAWELVEEMRQAHKDPGISGNWEGGGWDVSLSPKYDIVSAKTAPLAISRAYLLWRQSQDGGE